MRADEFIARRQTEWAHLEQLLHLAGSGRLSPLRPAEVLTLAALYRRATADLALAQRDWPGQPVQRYLNGLVARGHGTLYRGGGNVLSRLATFYGQTLPRTYRRSWPFLTASAALLFLPAIIFFFAVVAQPSLAYGLVPLDLIRSVHQHKLWTDIPPDTRGLAAGAIMTNNILVAVLAFAGGIGFTLPTVFVLINNGISIGAVLGVTQDYGLSGGLLQFMVGHGVLELSIIVAAGAAGLKIGWALIAPGRYKRTDALSQAMRDSITLIVGLAPVLVVAGIIEGNISPSDIAWPFHVAVGVGTGTLFYWYLLFAGRQERREVPR